MVNKETTKRLLIRIKELKIYIKCLEEFKKDTQKRIKKIENFLK